MIGGVLARRRARRRGGPLFALPVLDAAELPLSPVDTLLIHASGFRNRARVLKIIDSLTRAGYSVAGLSKLPPGAPDARLRHETIGGATVVYAPDAHDFRNGWRAADPAAGWRRMVAHLESALWPVAKAFAPRVIHSFDAAAIGLGHEFRDRLRAGGSDTLWFHDFTEYTAGHRFGASGGDGTWRDAVLRHEAAHASAMDHAFSVSPAVAAAMAKRYGLARQPTVLLNAPRLSDFDAAAQPTVRGVLKLAPETPLVVYSGGATRLRGLHTLVAALARLDGVHAALIADGESAYVRGLMKAARAGGFAERLHVLPYVAPARISSFLRDATLGVHPMIRYENGDMALPNKLFDYLHAGLPVVVTGGTAMAGLVEEFGMGASFAAEDEAALAAAIRSVLEEPADRWPGRSDRAPLERFSWERQEGLLLAAYREPIPESARAATAPE